MFDVALDVEYGFDTAVEVSPATVVSTPIGGTSVAVLTELVAFDTPEVSVAMVVEFEDGVINGSDVMFDVVG